MKHLLIALVAPLALAIPSFADVTMKSMLGSKAGPSTSSITYIKGNKMRNDTVTGDTTRTRIVDGDAQKMYVFDSKTKVVDVYDMPKLNAAVAKSVQVNDMTASMKANGKTKDIGGRTASGYDMATSVPATVGGAAGGMKMTVTMTGPVWIVKGAPGTADYLAFYKNAIEKGWMFSDPRLARTQPGQAKAMAEVYRQLAATGGIPYEMEMNVKMSGEGQLAAMFEKMGIITSTINVTGIDTAALAASVFAVPAGYQLKEQE